MKLLYLIVFYFFITPFVFAQADYQIPQSVFLAAGGFASNEDYAMNWSVGDGVVFSAVVEDNAITQGFEQPMICKTIPIITASNINTCSQPYRLKVSSGFHYYRWMLDTSLVANERDSIYLPVTNAKYKAVIGDSTGCYITTAAFETDFSLKRSSALVTPSTYLGRDTLLTASEGISYQWYMVTPQDSIARAIDKANEQSFRPYYNGEYFVKIHFDDQCISQSRNYKVNNQGQELLKGEQYSINDTTIFFNYIRSENYRLQIYPNPCKGYFTIDYESPLENNLTVKVFNILGKELEKKEIAKSTSRLKEEYVLHWLPGVYSIKVDDGTKVLIQNLIVQ